MNEKKSGSELKSGIPSKSMNDLVEEVMEMALSSKRNFSCAKNRNCEITGAKFQCEYENHSYGRCSRLQKKHHKYSSLRHTIHFAHTHTYTHTYTPLSIYLQQVSQHSLIMKIY